MINKKDFMCYEKIRLSGIVNMWHATMVVKLSGGILTREKCFEIMENYGDLKRKYIKEVK